MLRSIYLVALPLIVAVTAQLHSNNGVEYYGGTSNVRYQHPQRRMLQPHTIQETRPEVAPALRAAPATWAEPAASAPVLRESQPLYYRQPLAVSSVSATHSPIPQLSVPSAKIPAPLQIPSALPAPVVPIANSNANPNKHIVYMPMWVKNRDTPTQEMLTTPQSIPVSELSSVAEPLPVVEPLPAAEPLPVAESLPAVEPLPVAEPLPAAELLPVAAEPIVKPLPTPEALPAIVPVPIVNPLPTTEKSSILDISPEAESLPSVVVPAAKSLPYNEPWPVADLLPAAEQLPAAEPLPAAEILPVSISESSTEHIIIPQHNSATLLPSPQHRPQGALPPLLPKPVADRHPAFNHHSQTSSNAYASTPAYVVPTTIPIVYTTRPIATFTYPTQPTTQPPTQPPHFSTYPPPPPSTYATSAPYSTPANIIPTNDNYIPQPPIYGSQMLNFKCIHGDGYYSVVKECDSYVECKHNEAIKYSCPDGLHFNSNAKHLEYPCSYPSEVKCSEGAEQQIAHPSNECPRQYGLFSMNDGECSRYISCQEGLATIMNCPMGLVFDSQSSTCDWPVNVPQCNPQVFADLQCPEPPVNEDGEISDIIYKYRYHQQCSLYVGCQRGHPRLLSCERGLFFDEELQECVNEDLVTDCAQSRR